MPISARPGRSLQNVICVTLKISAFCFLFGPHVTSFELTGTMYDTLHHRSFDFSTDNGIDTKVLSDLKSSDVFPRSVTPLSPQSDTDSSRNRNLLNVIQSRKSKRDKQQVATKFTGYRKVAQLESNDGHQLSETSENLPTESLAKFKNTVTKLKASRRRRKRYNSSTPHAYWTQNENATQQPVQQKIIKNSPSQNLSFVNSLKNQQGTNKNVELNASSTENPNTGPHCQVDKVLGLAKDKFIPTVSSLSLVFFAAILTLLLYIRRRRRNDPERQGLLVRAITGMYYNQSGYCF